MKNDIKFDSSEYYTVAEVEEAMNIFQKRIIEQESDITEKERVMRNMFLDYELRSSRFIGFIIPYILSDFVNSLIARYLAKKVTRKFNRLKRSWQIKADLKNLGHISTKD